MKGRSRRWCFDLPGISLPSLCPTILPSPSILLTPSLFFTLSLSPLPSPSLARLLLSELSSPFHLFVGSNPPVLRFARPPTHPPSRSPLPVHTGGNMAAPCTLDTLRLRCLITQDTSSRGNRACYRTSPFPLFLLLPFFPFLSYIYSLSLSLFPSLLSDRLSLGREKKKERGERSKYFLISSPGTFFFFFLLHSFRPPLVEGETMAETRHEGDDKSRFMDGKEKRN